MIAVALYCLAVVAVTAAVLAFAWFTGNLD